LRIAGPEVVDMELLQAKVAGTMRKIVDFHLDDNLDWVAEFECGHHQQVRLTALWTQRYWLATPQGRHEMLGRELNCSACWTN